jgi:hypothetical protein
MFLLSFVTCDVSVISQQCICSSSSSREPRDQLTTHSRIRLQKLIIAHLFNKFRAFYRTRVLTHGFTNFGICALY